MSETKKPLTYLSYLKLDELLSLQQPLSQGPEHDEMLFIVIHQVYELWFKQLLHELLHLRRMLQAAQAVAALGTLKRILTILKTLVAQVDVLETMTPMSFNSFRARLEASSGFQSAQFRQLEFLLGQKEPRHMQHHPAGTRGRAELERLLHEPGIYDALLQYLQHCGFAVPSALLDRDFAHGAAPSSDAQAVLLEVYRQNALPAQVCERLLDLDEGLQEWRYRHVKMVERTIGSKMGTGGSAGATYLRDTLFRPVFPDLWEIRSQL